MRKRSSVKGKRNIAIFGGSFDPPTIAHIQVATEVTNSEKIDLLLFVPCGDGRQDKKLKASCLQRIQMVNLIIKDILGENEFIKVDETELNSGFLSTFNLLQILKNNEEYMHDHLHFCIGTDLIPAFIKWDPRLNDECSFILLKRPGYEIQEDQKPKNVYLEVRSTLNTSSSLVRNRIYENEQTAVAYNKISPKDTQGRFHPMINGFTTKNVTKFIEENKLYITTEKVK